MKYVLLLVLLAVAAVMIWSIYRRSHARSQHVTDDPARPVLPAEPSGRAGLPAAERGADEILPGPEQEHRATNQRAAAESDSKSTEAVPEWRPEDATRRPPEA